MKKIIPIVGLLTILFTLFLPSVGRTDHHNCFAKHFFEVKGPSGSSYLLGSMHIVPLESVLTPELRIVMQQTKTFVFETDISSIKKSDLLRAEGPNLDAMLSAKSWARLQALAANVPTEILKRLSAQGVASILAQFILSNFDKMPAEIVGQLKLGGMDYSLEAWGREQNKDILFLESVTEATDLFKSPEFHRAAILKFDKMLSQTDAEIIAAFLNEVRGIQSQIDIYKSGDVAALTQLTRENFRSPGLLNARPSFLENRNEKWIEVLSEILVTKQALVVVGAGHLYEKNGLLDLLESRNILMKKISIPCTSDNKVTEVKNLNDDTRQDSSAEHTVGSAQNP